MKILTTVSILMLISACSPDRQVVRIINGNNGANGTSCSVSNYSLEDQTLGALIQCGDGSSAIVLNGTSGSQGIAGAQGETGADGAQGIAGNNGGSCSLSRGENESFVTISCPDSAPQFVHDGLAGTNGEDGAQGQTGATGTNALGCTLTYIGSNHYQLTCGSTTANFSNVEGH